MYSTLFLNVKQTTKGTEIINVSKHKLSNTLQVCHIKVINKEIKHINTRLQRLLVQITVSS